MEAPSTAAGAAPGPVPAIRHRAGPACPAGPGLQRGRRRGVRARMLRAPKHKRAHTHALVHTDGARGPRAWPRRRECPASAVPRWHRTARMHRRTSLRGWPLSTRTVASQASAARSASGRARSCASVRCTLPLCEGGRGRRGAGCVCHPRACTDRRARPAVAQASCALRCSRAARLHLSAKPSASAAAFA